MALENIGTRIFQHMDISALGNFGTMQSNMDVSAQTFWHRHFGICAEMCCCAETSILPKYQCAKMFQFLNVPVLKGSHANISRCQNVPCRKFHVPNSLLAEMSGWAEISSIPLGLKVFAKHWIVLVDTMQLFN